MFFECGEKERATSFDLTLEPRRIFHPPFLAEVIQFQNRHFTTMSTLYFYFYILLVCLKKYKKRESARRLQSGRLEINAYAGFDPALDIKTKSSKTFLQWATWQSITVLYFKSKANHPSPSKRIKEKWPTVSTSRLVFFASLHLVDLFTVGFNYISVSSVSYFWKFWRSDWFTLYRFVSQISVDTEAPCFDVFMIIQ